MKNLTECETYAELQQAVLDACVSQELREVIENYFSAIRVTAYQYQVGTCKADLFDPTDGQALAREAAGYVLIIRYKDYGDGALKTDTTFFEVRADQVVQFVHCNPEDTDIVHPDGGSLH